MPTGATGAQAHNVSTNHRLLSLTQERTVDGNGTIHYYDEWPRQEARPFSGQSPVTTSSTTDGGKSIYQTYYPMYCSVPGCSKTMRRSNSDVTVGLKQDSAGAGPAPARRRSTPALMRPPILLFSSLRMWVASTRWLDSEFHINHSMIGFWHRCDDDHDAGD